MKNNKYRKSLKLVNQIQKIRSKNNFGPKKSEIEKNIFA